MEFNERKKDFNETISELEKSLVKLDNLHASFDYLKISIASPSRIKTWAERKFNEKIKFGEVKSLDTLDFRTYQPEREGIFCEQIFGPTKNWKCRCGKFYAFTGQRICDECFVEITDARVRRYRMGYIELNFPVTHLWYLKGNPSYLTILLRCFHEKLTITNIEQMVYLKLSRRRTKKNEEKNSFEDVFGPIKKNTSKREFLFFMTPIYMSSNRRRGSELIKAALEKINIPFEIEKARSLIKSTFVCNFSTKKSPDKRILIRIRILESFLATKIDPSWIILTVLPVLPPNLRPLIELESGRLVSADVNDLYISIMRRNKNLLRFLSDSLSTSIQVIHAKRLLQEGVDSLIDNARLPKHKIYSVNDRALKSLTEILEGKQGRFRHSLLGKRVDYSGRSVIVVGPSLRINECGLPYNMAVELFQPFLVNQLLKTKILPPSHNTKLARNIIKKNKPFVWTLIKKLVLKHCILLNRAPTLHRFGIQAFDPIIVLGQAIHLHPLACTGFNADFDGDQMAVHLPLYQSSQLEAKTMMRPCYNILSPSSGEVILKPTQDMVIGAYYLTLMIFENPYLSLKWFATELQVINAFYQKKIQIHNPILVRYSLKNLPHSFTLEKSKLIFSDKISFLDINTKNITVYKIYKIQGRLEKFYFLTNIGILIARQKTEKRNHYNFENQVLIKTGYVLTDLFLETTAGRILFSLNYKYSLI